MSKFESPEDFQGPEAVPDGVSPPGDPDAVDAIPDEQLISRVAAPTLDDGLKMPDQDPSQPTDSGQTECIAPRAGFMAPLAVARGPEMPRIEASPAQSPISAVTSGGETTGDQEDPEISAVSTSTAGDGEDRVTAMLRRIDETLRGGTEYQPPDPDEPDWLTEEALQRGPAEPEESSRYFYSFEPGTVRDLRVGGSADAPDNPDVPEPNETDTLPVINGHVLGATTADDGTVTLQFVRVVTAAGEATSGHPVAAPPPATATPSPGNSAEGADGFALDEGDVTTADTDVSPEPTTPPIGTYPVARYVEPARGMADIHKAVADSGAEPSNTEELVIPRARHPLLSLTREDFDPRVLVQRTRLTWRLLLGRDLVDPGQIESDEDQAE